MAAARAVPSLGGYDDEFVNAVEEDLHCAICQLPLKEAVQTGKCGHRFCRQCLDEHFRRLELNRQPLICPVDRNNLIRDKDIFPDKATERKILSFIIRCPNEGCQWTGELRSKDNHLASCPLKVVSCTNKNCEMTLARNKLQKHVTTTCPWRILHCTFCDVSHPEWKTEVHQNGCKRFPLNCPQSCGAVIPREEIQRRELEKHLQTAVRLHLDLACVKLNATEVRLSNTQVELTNTREEFKAMTGKLEEKFKETTRKLEEKYNVVEKMMQSSEHSYFEWKISGFSEVLRKSISGEKNTIYSDTFYRYGYKCRLRCDPNGFGSGKNTHLTIGMNIMNGEHDDVLPWSFYKKVTFTLIDQQEDATKRKNIVESILQEDPEDPAVKECFAKPVTDQNTTRGFHKFVSHEKLRERRYIVDGTIIIQLQVSPQQ